LQYLTALMIHDMHATPKINEKYSRVYRPEWRHRRENESGGISEPKNHDVIARRKPQSDVQRCLYE